MEFEHKVLVFLVLQNNEGGFDRHIYLQIIKYSTVIVNKRHLISRPIIMSLLQRMPRNEGDSKVFLGNLPPDCKVSDIQHFLDKFGRVRNILIKQGKYGFAEFDDPRDADDAVYELHGRKLLGSRITMEIAKVKLYKMLKTFWFLVIFTTGEKDNF